MYDDVSLYAHLRAVRDRLRSAFGRPPGGSDATGRAAGTGPLYAVIRSAPARRLAFFGDLVSVLVRRLYHGRRGDDVLILDRYLYDTLVEASGAGWPSLGALLRITPRPDVPILVDVEPALAFTRKGEYDLAALAQRRAVYRRIFAAVRDPLIVENVDLASATERVRDAVLARAR